MNLHRTLTCAALLAPALPVHALGIALNAPATVQVGEVFTVDVVASGLFDGLHPQDELIAFGFDVSATGAITWDGALIAAQFDDDSALFAATDVAASSFPGFAPGELTEPFTLATLSFTALAPGLATLAVSTTPGDFNEGLVYLHSDNAPFGASLSIAVVPEPDAWALLLAGLGMIGYMVMRLGKH